MLSFLCVLNSTKLFISLEISASVSLKTEIKEACRSMEIDNTIRDTFLYVPGYKGISIKFSSDSNMYAPI